MSYINKVFNSLKQLWMGIRLNTHTYTNTDVKDLRELAEVPGDESVQTMPLRHG